MVRATAKPPPLLDAVLFVMLAVPPKVLEGIIAVQHTDRPGARITAGLLLAKVYRQSDDSYLGGFACEYSGTRTVEEAHANLREAMNGLFARRYSPKL